jgi:NRAMP (natural resistance-associated macrophage protein)-like metal ion transporter
MKGTNVPAVKKFNKARLLLMLSIIGPGIITASVDNDPGGITTYTVAGSTYGFMLLWTIIPIIIALVLIQEMAARMGIASGKGLADLIREYMGLKATFYVMLLLIVVNFGNVMSQFAGIAAAGELFGLSKYALIPLCALGIWALVVYGNYKIIERVFLAASLLYISYVISGFMAGPPWGEVTVELFKPHIIMESNYLFLIVALIGTTIAPWMMFYLQSSIVEKGIKPSELKYSTIDVISGSVVTGIIAFFIIVASAVTLYANGITVSTAEEAARALEPLAGAFAAYLFAFGLFNAGVFSAAILPLSTAYSICEGMGWESGVNKGFKDAPQFYTIITFLIAAGAALIMIPDIPLIMIMIISQVLNGILLPIILIYMLRLSSSPRVMGKYKNTPLFNFVTWSICIIIIVLSGLMTWFYIVPAVAA